MYVHMCMFRLLFWMYGTVSTYLYKYILPEIWWQPFNRKACWL